MNYRVLKTVATLFNVIGVLQIIFGAGGTFMAIASIGMSQPQIVPVLLIAGGIICALSIIWFATAQFIYLFVNIANDVSNIQHNIYYIASESGKDMAHV